jgi:hypothetical protein
MFVAIGLQKKLLMQQTKPWKMALVVGAIISNPPLMWLP